MFIYLSVIMFLPRQRTRLEHRIIRYCIYCSCSYIFLFTQKSTMSLTCLSSAYLGATTSLKKPQSLLWMTRCLVISFFFFLLVKNHNCMKTSNMSNLTIFTNNNKAMRDLLLYSIFSECNAYLELIMGCTTQIGWNDSGLLYGKSWVQTPGRLPTCVLQKLLRPHWLWFETLSQLRRASC